MEDPEFGDRQRYRHAAPADLHAVHRKLQPPALEHLLFTRAAGQRLDAPKQRDDPRDQVLQAYLDAESYCLTTYQTASRLMAGGKIGAESSTNKIFWSELDQNMHATAMSILGTRAELLPHAPDAAGVGTWLDGWLFSQSGPIYAGTNEVQRNIIAERMLGMPR